VEHFNDGSSKKLNIQYVREKQFLGTIGSSSLIETFENDTVLIMNSDLLTNIDYEDMYNEFMAQDADLIVASIPYNVSIPYAVLETKDGKISGLKEKPTYTYYSNAGIYMVKRSLMDIIPKNEKYDATDLIEDLIKKSKKVIPYSITSYWLDIGKHEDFEKAQIDIKHIKFD
jgi:NDP-sugar pyrophosphorylase family protein